MLDKILLSKIEPIETSLNFNGHEFKKLLSKVDTIEKTVKALQLENQALKSQINSVNTMVKENSALLDKQEQYMRHDCLEIKGIPLSQDEDARQMAVQVADLLDVGMGLENISISHRLPKVPPWTDSSGTVHLPSPSVIAKFVRRDVREKFYRARYKLKNKTTRDLGLASDEGSNIYIAESLTQARKKLFKSASKVKKDLKFNFISTTNGRIFLKRNRDSRSIPITCESDLGKLKASSSGQGQGQTGV